ncbi:SusD/RagB family nutrient-binding outer membrane lipoprotein [Lacibacter luteus]|uniref:SusD/RagB family nutrient-binding outer membrane lipoprotein n=1 Tax=Lacibacter luteus TaxID=2508719 RepID=A0A4Q1CGR8_9BACT|nr:SusD/RagB family nutrient-binding outer membrane lipoprotein [Lacibacter luteus]RXK59358.1 SusD/RagB family nutrient-binding outer membrane lipoprotein [Lacibacter luteus]
MKKLLYINVVVLLLALASCQKRFEELQSNPNIATSVPPDLILNRLINGVAGGMGGIEPWGAVARYNQFYCRNFEYYGDNQYNWNSGPFSVYQDILKNVTQMETEAQKSSGTDKTPYHAIAKFLKAYYYYNLTSLMGDVPMSEAAKALDGVLQPKYDTQKEVFLQIIKWLEEANTDFAYLKSSTNLTVKGDIFYNGDYDKWRKLANSYKLRVLISLSKKDADADLRIKQRFQEVLSSASSFPVFESMADNFKYVYITPTNNYSTNPVSFGFDAIRYNMAATYVRNSAETNDPRILLTCEPAWKLVNDNGWAPTDFRAYVAAGTGEAMDVMESKAHSYSICHINRYRYYRTYTGENFTIAGYPEMCFNIAEAINRGWVTGNAEDWYKKGIQASISFYGIVDGTNTGNYLAIGKTLGEWTSANFTFNFNTYYNQSKVVYETGTAGLNKILLQKYLAFFQNSGWEAYYNYRRTGVPAFSTGVGIGNNGNIPKRWAYPSNEQQRNATNWKAAVDRQFAGSDNMNAEMWLIK